MIHCCLIPVCWPMRTEWLRSILPDNLTRGARAVCGYKLTSCNISWDTDNALGRFPCRKWMHGIPCLTAFVVFPTFCLLDNNIVFASFGKGSRVSRKREGLSKKSPRSFFRAYSFLHFSISSWYSSKWLRTRFSTKLERLLPLSPNLRTMRSARSCVSLLR